MATENLRVLAEMTQDLSQELSEIAASAQAAQSTIDEVSDELNSTAVSGTAAEESLSEASGEMLKMSATGRAAASSVDELEDEMSAATRAANALSISMGNLSLNVGAFSVALRNLTTQVPVLITTVGTLISVLGGLAAAAIAASAALGGIFAAGLLANAQAMEERFAGIEDLGQALQQTMSTLRDMFLRALEPLLNDQAIAFFQSMVEGLMEVVNLTAVWLNNLMQSGGFQTFFDSLSRLESGFRDLLGALGGVFEESEQGGRSLAIIFVDLLNVLMSGLADAIEFFDSILRSMTNDGVGNAIDQLVHFTEELIRLGSSILQGVLPVIASLIGVIGTLAEMINALGAENVAAITTVLTLGFAFDRLAGSAATLITVIGGVSTGFSEIISDADTTGEALRGLNEGFRRFLRVWASGVTQLADATFGTAIASEADEAAEATSRLDDFTPFAALTGGQVGEMSALENFGRRIDNKLLDVKRSFRNFGGDEALTEQLGNMFSSARSRVNDFIFNINAADNRVTSAINDMMDIGGDDTFLQRKLAPAADAVGNFADTARSKFRDFAFGIEADNNRVTNALNDMMNIGGDANIFQRGIQRMRDGFSNATEQIMDGAGNIRNSVTNSAKAVGGRFKSAIGTASAALQNFSFQAAFAKTQALLFGEATLASTLGISSMIPAVFSLDLSLTSLTGGLTKLIPLLFGFVAAGAAVVGVLGNAKGAASGAKSVFDTLKNAVMDIADRLLPIFIDAWNSFVDILSVVTQPLNALLTGLSEIGQALGIVSDGGGSAGGAMSMLIDLFIGAASITADFYGILGLVGSFIGDVLTLVIDSLVTSITAMISVVRVAMNVLNFLATSNIPFVSSAISGLISFVDALIDAFLMIPEAVTTAFSGVLDFISSAMEQAIGFINDLIKEANKVPGVNIATVGSGTDPTQGLKTDEEAVLEGAEAVQEGAQSAYGSFTGQQPAEFNFENTQQNNVEEINARPEDEERLKRLVKDAMNESNTFRRQSDGYSG